MKKFLKGFLYAFQGVIVAVRTQRNMRVHGVAILVVTITGIFLELTAIEWGIIALTMGLVIISEMMNTAIELLVDMVSPEFNEQAGKVKDIAAGGVFLAAIVSLVVAIYIFGNKIFNLLL